MREHGRSILRRCIFPSLRSLGEDFRDRIGWYTASQSLEPTTVRRSRLSKGELVRDLLHSRCSMVRMGRLCNAGSLSTVCLWRISVLLNGHRCACIGSRPRFSAANAGLPAGSEGAPLDCGHRASGQPTLVAEVGPSARKRGSGAGELRAADSAIDSPTRQYRRVSCPEFLVEQVVAK